MTSYSFNPAGALDVAANMKSMTTKLESSLSDLKQSVTTFLNANQGQSITNYGDAQNKWSQGQVEMNQSLTQGTLALEDIHDAYIDADNKGAAAFI